MERHFSISSSVWTEVEQIDLSRPNAMYPPDHRRELDLVAVLRLGREE